MKTTLDIRTTTIRSTLLSMTTTLAFILFMFYMKLCIITIQTTELQRNRQIHTPSWVGIRAASPTQLSSNRRYDAWCIWYRIATILACGVCAGRIASADRKCFCSQWTHIWDQRHGSARWWEPRFHLQVNLWNSLSRQCRTVWLTLAIHMCQSHQNNEQLTDSLRSWWNAAGSVGGWLHQNRCLESSQIPKWASVYHRLQWF